MRPSQLKQAVRYLMKADRAMFIWGPPGVGKSDIVESIAKEDKLQLIDFRMALRDPTDIRGFPMPDAATKTMKFYRDSELPTKGKGILFMDELNSATQATQAAAMQLTLTGKIGDYTLPVGWRIVATGNRESDRSVVNRMPSALSLRFVHLDLDVSLDDWCEWAMANGTPIDMIAFMRFRPNLLHAIDPSVRSSPNPRGWKFVADITGPMGSAANDPATKPSLAFQAISREIEFDLIKGTIGEGAASEFVAFQQVYRDLPSIDSIMLNPDTVPVPTGPAVLYALSTALGARAKKDTFDRMMQYVSRMPVEFQVVTVRDAVRTQVGVASTKAFIKWSIDNSSIAL